MSFEIDSSIPLPAKRNRYPFAEMTSGDSIPLVGEALAKKARNAAYQYAKKASQDTGTEVKFALRKEGDVVTETGETVKTYRLWRE